MNRRQRSLLEAPPPGTFRASELARAEAVRRSPLGGRSLLLEIKRAAALPPAEWIERANRELLEQRCDF